MDDPKCRSTIYGKPILLFHQADPSSDPVFYGKSNMNYDKGSEYVFGFTDQYDVECWEFKNNTSDACNFLGPVPEIWVDDFEARYPEESTEIERFKEMHDWVVSTKDNLEKFKMEFEDYFDMHFSLIYYVYTFFALMVDQRAKNMFLTYWGETGKFYPYFYDNDTSWGINNEGQLVFDYYHTDEDLLEGANVYNGQNSVLWCNFRDAFPDEIKATYQDLRSNGVLNYDELVAQFITNGSDKWSESIYNEDADFKYISMLESDGDASNLGQVRGTGEEHFRYFIENRLNYCDGRWYAGDYPDDYVALRIYTPNTWAGVEPNADITVTPYSHMYAGVRYKANGTLYQKRVSANEVTTFEAPDETFNDTETAIYGASQLSSLGDLSPLYCGSINVSSATKLTELIIGSDAEGYSNPNLNDLSVGTNNLLKVLNVRNCPKLTDPLALSGCPNIEEIYAAGSCITGVELANSGYLKVLELPATIANLTLKNQPYIENLTFEGYGAIKTINIENCPTVASLNILGAATNVERVRLTNVNWSYDTAAEVLALADRNLAGIDENGLNTDKMWIDGKCHIKALSGAEYLEVKEAFPYIEITYDSLTAVLTYKSEDGNTELARQTIQNGGDGNYTDTTPTKESTAQYTYTFAGWSLTPGGEPDPDALKNVEADRTVYAAFNSELRKYTVKFYNGTTLLQTVSNVPYGSSATYTDSTPINNSTGNPADFEFYGWKPAPTNIQGDTSCYAQFHDMREITDSWATISENVANGTATSKYAVGAFKMLDIGEVSLIEFPHTGSSVVFNDEIHILGGDSGFTHCKFNNSNPTLTDVDNLPVNYRYGDAVVYKDEIYIIGGQSSTKWYKWNGVLWDSSLANLPYTFYKTSAVVYNDEIHILGSSMSGCETMHYKWDGTEWTSVSTLPYNFYQGSAVVYNNEIHILGSNSSSSCRKYHYKWNGSEWTSVSTLPYNFYQGSAVVYNDEIHILGSYDSSYRNRHYKWNGSEWTSVSTLPVDFYDCNAVVYDNKIHILGGYLNNKKQKYIYYYIPETKTWSKYVTESIPMQIVGHNHDELPDGVNKWEGLATLPYSFYSSSAVVLNNEIHILGSINSSYQTAHYKWNGTEWTSVSTLPYNFYYGSAVVLNNEIHILGSYNSSYRTAHYKWNGTEWTSVSTLPYDFYYGCAVVLNNEIHILGSDTSKTSHYKWNGTEWTSVSTLPYGFSKGSAVVYNNEIHILGGSGTSAAMKSHYKWNGSEWTSVSTLPYDFYTGTATVVGGEIRILGSSNSSYQKYCYKWTGLEWVKMNDIPYNYFEACAVEFNGSLYTLGSKASGYNRVFYKLSGPSWEQIISQYLNDVNSGVAVYNNELYLARSWNTGLYKWDGSTWVSVATSPVRIESNRLVVYNNELYIFWYTNSVGVIYKWNGSELTSVSNPDSLNINPYSVCVYNGLIHAGDNGKNAHYTFDGSTWTNIGTVLNTATGGEYGFRSWFVYDNVIYSLCKNHFLKYNGSEWVSLDNLPFISYCSSIIEYNGEMHVIGCRTGIDGKAVLNMHYVYNGAEWRRELDSPINGHVQTAVYRGHLLCGGYILTNPRATLTFLAGNLLKDSRVMNSTNHNAGGWNTSELREYLNGEFVESLPTDLQTVITEVKKLSDEGHGSVTPISTNDDIWIPSFNEVTEDKRTDMVDGQGDIYPVFTDTNSRIRIKTNGESSIYTLRTTRTTVLAQYFGVLHNGAITFVNAGTACGVLPGFCI